ncbi:sugar ABC transporter substrate-binding protein [Nocardioides perillae]|uniref:Arabinogalactan oligomer/maltooligosaccharide transport system substrate-binding protein n=1 Tax=Nocardioides perillae TaxID=1119534 RepID=A0A7Y9RXW8_9ACTN|nr:maltose ABC transporter substrate-binding protein [Nocardioides perillae]NYG56603.1 arabinogalactan oligomer/maltooligosaccharide transport system substrate-binding protein [Nocardioides perillae]
MRIARTLVPAVLAVALTACGGGGGSSTSSADTTPSEPTESSTEEAVPTRGDADLVIWTDALKIDAVKTVADTFAEQNGISVEVQAVSSDLQTNFVTANTAGNGPDVVVGAHDWIGNLVANGAIEPLQLTPDQLSGYSEKAVQATTYEGQLYGVPYGIEALALYRNTEVVPEEPANLTEAIDAGKQAVQAGEVESALNLPVGENGDAYHMQPVLTSMGGYLFAYDEASGYDASDLGVGEPGSVEAARKVAQLAKERVLRTSISGDNSIALFTEGKAAFLISGPWALGDIKASGIDYAIQPIPGFAGEEPAEPFMGAQAFMVASGAENAAFAQEFVTVGVNNEEAMQALYEGATLPPAMTSVQDGLQDEDIALFAEAANQAAPMPALPEMAAVWEPLGKAYAAIVGGANPEKTMRDAGRTIESAIQGG